MSFLLKKNKKKTFLSFLLGTVTVGGGMVWMFLAPDQLLTVEKFYRAMEKVKYIELWIFLGCLGFAFFVQLLACIFAARGDSLGDIW
jgi:hypothetical protein